MSDNVCEIEGKSYKKIDYLNEDKPIPGQKWACFSFVSPEGIMNCKIRGFKFRGAYETFKEADKKAKELQEIDPDFHIFVGQGGKWLEFDPDPKKAKDEVYWEKKLQQLVKGYKKQRSKIKQMELERKENMIQNAINNEKAEKARANKVRKRLQKKLQNKQSTQINIEDSKNDEIHNKKLDGLQREIDEKEKNLKEEKKKILEKQDIVNQCVNNMDTIEKKLERMQELYNDINKRRTRQRKTD